MEGRVMVWHNGSFGRVCPDGFGQEEAHVVCRQLGFNNDGGDPDINVDFGKGSGPILVSNINCKGNESSLSNCKHPEFRFGECSGTPDASVVCKFVPMRLVNGSGPHEGRVEVFDRREWKTVCDYQWDDKDASVVCRQLGYNGTGAISKHRAYFGGGRGNIVSSVQCNGNEGYFTDCKYRYVSSCSHTRDSSVICTVLTLVGGSNSMEGRVMVWHNGSFGRVCRDGFGQEEAHVVCRHLGFNNDGGDPDINVDFGNGSGPVLVSNINCKGNELSLSACKHPAFRFGECGCTPDVSVVCKFVPVRLVNGSGPHEGRVEVFDKREWKTVCDYQWDDKDASVVCRQLGYSGTGARSKIGAYFGEGRGNIVADVQCNGHEGYITDCRYRSVSPCRHNRDVSVICNETSKTTNSPLATTKTIESSVQSSTIPEDIPVGSPPNCKPGVHEFEFNIKAGEPSWGNLCMDIGSFDSSSLCSDDDDALIFSINEDPFGFFKLFKLVRNKQILKPCLRFTALDQIQEAKAPLTIIAKEDSSQGRTATLNILITFNRPPTVANRIINWIVNIAELGALDVIKQSQAQDSGSITLTSVNYQENSLVSATIHKNKLYLNHGKNSTDNDMKRIVKLQVKMSDDGIPSLSTNVTVQIVIVRLECTSTNKMAVNIGELQSVKTLPIGQINCAASRGYSIRYDGIHTALQQGLELSFHDGIVSIIQDGVTTIMAKTKFIVVNVMMVQFPSIHVNVKFQLEFAFYGIMRFQSTYISWTRELTDNSTMEYRNQVKNVTDMISKVVDKSVSVHIIQFRQDSWVDVHLTCSSQAVCKKIESLLLHPASFNDSGIRRGRVHFNNRSSHIFVPTLKILNKAKHILGGDTVVFCEADVIKPVGSVSVEWTLDGAVVRPLFSSRFQISTGFEFPWRLQSNLTITNITMIDQGTVQCHISDLSRYGKVGSIPLAIIFPPTVGVPKTQYVRCGISINLKCEVLKPVGVYTTLMWIKDGINIQNGSDLNRVVARDTNLTCIGSNIAGRGKGNTTKIIIIKGPLTCPRDTDERGTHWSEASPDATAEQSCPLGYAGSVSRYCNSDGKWLTEDYSSCIQASLTTIMNQIEQVKAGIVVSEPDKLLANLTKITKQSKLEKGEILHMISAMKTLTQITNETTQNSPSAQNKTKHFAKESVILVSALFDSEQSENMKTLEYENSSIIQDLMETMDKVSKLVGENLPDGNSETFQSENIGCPFFHLSLWPEQKGEGGLGHTSSTSFRTIKFKVNV
ncbi:uncharacterized protein LOC126826746 isoform X2 [Patella vulgata]|uniref:uncharacterized protein LOC126826746 isoform X2 n=1 Tax=Patella vulgata TaxID=6465 RepID=UPI00217FDB38|nr:uncharacterized protein LOC126826746 isoform X2 [Patella vulgata]